MRGDMAFTGRAVFDVFQPTLANATRIYPKNVKGGNLGELDQVQSYRSEGGRRSRRRRGRSPPIIPLATAPTSRRWAAGSGPEGRG